MIRVELQLTDAEAAALAKAQVHSGWGVVRSRALVSADQKLHAALVDAQVRRDAAKQEPGCQDGAHGQ